MTSIASEDSAPESVSNDSSESKFVREGSAEIQIPDGILEIASKQHSQGERKDDEGKSEFRILEALSATGLRSIRYAKELRHVTQVVANDISKAAIENIERNIEHNGVEDKVKVSHSDACEVMFNNRHPSKRFHAVDLDPYGCPSNFLDSAVQCVADGGLLLVTCTDMAVLCGNSPETCFVKYGAISLKSKACHEMALRIALQCIQSHAGRYKRYITPLLSISVDFYIRLIVRISTSAVKCKEVSSKMSMVYHCNGCDATTLQPLGQVKTKKDAQKNWQSYHLCPAPAVDKTCSHCGGKHSMGGPIWSAPLHDLGFVAQVIDSVEKSNLNTKNRLLGVLSMILEELYDVPLYYNISKLCSNVRASSIPMMTFRSAVLNGGYRISYSHASKESFKTDAPMTFIWDVLREWVKENAVSQKSVNESATAENILKKSIQHEIDFSLRPDANPLSRKNKLLRFQVNPAPFWGPGTRSLANVGKPSKAVRNQNKKKKRKANAACDASDGKKIALDDAESTNATQLRQ